MILALLIIFGFLVALYALDYDLRCLRQEIETEEDDLDYALLNRLIDDISPRGGAER